MKKTKRVPIKYKILLDGIPNAGPNPNITGMKKHHYGVDSYCVMCGNYLYNLGKDITDAKTNFIYNNLAK